MATKFQIKRSSVSGVVPTTGDISPGELAVNLTDKKIFSANSTATFELGSNLTNLNVTGNLVVTSIVADGTIGTNGQVLTSNGSVAYWSIIPNGTGVNTYAQYTWNNVQTYAADIVLNNDKNINFKALSGASVGMRQQSDDNFVFYTTNSSGGARAVFNVYANTDAPNQNSAFRFNTPVDMGSAGIYANNSLGSAGQVLTSTGGSVYWSSPGGTGTVTSVATGNGLTGGPVTSSGTISVQANNGIVANTSGLFVNTGYIATLNANSATYLSNSSGTLSNITSWITGNSATAYSNAVSYVDGKNYANISVLEANVAYLQGEINAVYANTVTAYNNATAYVDNKYYANTSQLSANIVTVQLQITANSTTAYSNAVSYVDSKLYANTSQLDANIALVQSQITANAVTTYSNAVSYVDSKLYANTSQLDANIALVQSQITANSATAYSNAVSYVDGKLYANTSQLDANISFVQTQITSNSATAYSNAISYVDGKLYANTSQLDANIALVQSQITANSDTAYSNAVSYVDSKSFANTLQLTANAATAYSNAIAYSSNADNLTSGTVAEARLPYRMDQNVRTTDAVEFSSITVTGNLVVNGSYTVVSGNSVTFTDNMLYLNQGISANITNITSNGTSVVFTANNNYQVGWDVFVNGVNPSSYNGNYLNITAANSTSFTVANTNTDSYVSGGMARGKSESNPDIGFAAGYNDGTYHHTGLFRDHSSGAWKVFDSYLPEPDTSIYIDQANASFRIANFQANTIYIGQNDSYGSINSTAYTGNANTSTYANGSFTNTFTVGTSGYFVANGYLGIGVSSPTSVLDVNGTITTRAAGGEGGQLSLANPDNASLGMIVDVGSADVGRVFSTRNNSTLQLGQLSGTGGIITLHTEAAERLRIANNGNIGIGNTTPNDKLAVTGNVNVSDTITTDNLVVTNSVNASSISVNNNFYSQTTTNKTLAVSISVSNVLTLDLAQSNFFTVVLDKNINTITVNNYPANVVSFFSISLDIDGIYTVAWPANFKWKDGTPPTISSNTSDTQTFILYTADGGTTVQAFNAGTTR